MIPVPKPVLNTFAASFGTVADRLNHFGGGHESSDGIVYAYPYADKRRLLKIMTIPVKEQRIGLLCLEERLGFMRFLGENGAQIAFPRMSPQGNLFETTLLEPHVWVGYTMDIAPGVTLKEKTWNEHFFRNWGQTVGLLHRLAMRYPSWKASVDPDTGEEFLTWKEEWEGFYNWCQDDQVKEKWVEIKRQLDTLPVTREVFGFIHNDPHIRNLLMDGERITLLDFDVANHHWFVNDIAIACQSILAYQSGGMGGPLHNREKLFDFLTCFLEGYQHEHHLPSEWLARLDLFIAYRRILLFIVMHGWVSSKPSLHGSWKGMILSQPDLIGNTFTTS
jgi:Ser/Thr protein kinase RdoA (MazF antagonist)